MKFIPIALAGLLVASFVGIADAAPQKGKSDATAQRQARCQAQAAKRYSAVRFLARRDYVRRCMGQGRKAKSA
jgi:hypothetical protein